VSLKILGEENCWFAFRIPTNLLKAKIERETEFSEGKGMKKKRPCSRGAMLHKVINEFNAGLEG